MWVSELTVNAGRLKGGYIKCHTNLTQQTDKMNARDQLHMYVRDHKKIEYFYPTKCTASALKLTFGVVCPARD